ncbi:hypothetical protein SteCoe_37044 [Stentor coeruleus]|uniref:Porin n=1 Tax=Stentor coeruleus TaxID=5963 RepID=A0A1R2AP30_9CILI|nr:hypothetical protein SteCoe_37044 [Stentor coeruleus]
MAKLENFTGLTKSQEDLLKKYYCFGSLGLLNFNVANNTFTFHTRIAERKEQVTRASAWLQYKNDLFLLKAKKRNDRFSHYKLELTPSKAIQNFKAIFECKLTGAESKNDASVAVEYNHEKFKEKITYFNNQNSLRFQITTGKPEYGFGLDAKLKLEDKEFENLTSAFWWAKSGARLVVKHVGKDYKSFGNFEASFFQAISPLANLASKVVTDWNTKATTVEVGGDYKYDDSTFVKGKINSNGNLALALTRTLNNKLRASIATEYKAQSLLAHSNEGYKFGIRFDFTH